MKCTINENNEVTGIWEDDAYGIPEDAVPCDSNKEFIAFGNPGETLTYFYKLENGKVIATEEGLKWEAKQYQRDRKAEYPSIEELVVALYDTDDKADIEAKRAEVKKKYPKPE